MALLVQHFCGEFFLSEFVFGYFKAKKKFLKKGRVGKGLLAGPLKKELFLQLPLETPLLAQYCDYEHSRTLSLLSFLYFFLCAQIRLSVLSKYICVVWDRVEDPGVLVGCGSVLK